MNKFDISNYVVQSNDLITSDWKMDRTTLKLFEMAVAALDTSKENPSTDVILKKDDIFHMFNATDEDRYYRFERHVKKLLKQVVDLKLPNDRVGAVVPVTFVSWGKKETDQRVVIRFNDVLMPQLVELKSRFTKYSISNLINLTSKYAIIIYKLAKMEYWKGSECTYSMKALREITDTVNLYSRFDNFEKKVLVQAMDEINNGHTDIVMSYEKIKEGRRVVAIRFHTRDRLSYHDNDFLNPKPIKGLTDEDVTMSFDDTNWEV